MFRYFRGCLGVDLSTREGYSVKKTVWYTVFSCKSAATAKPGRMQGNAEAAVSPYNNLRPRQRSAAIADGRVRRRAQAGQHNEADSEPRTSWRVGAASQSAPLLVLLVSKVHTVTIQRIKVILK